MMSQDLKLIPQHLHSAKADTGRAIHRRVSGTLMYVLTCGVDASVERGNDSPGSEVIHMPVSLGWSVPHPLTVRHTVPPHGS